MLKSWPMRWINQFGILGATMETPENLLRQKLNKNRTFMDIHLVESESYLSADEKNLSADEKNIKKLGKG